jgi:hypothetical protein
MTSRVKERMAVARKEGDSEVLRLKMLKMLPQ